jgi:glutamate/aspartate transport system permease protein
VSLDWSIFCRSTTGNAQLAGCLGQNGELSYLQWLLSAWGWTATVALLGFIIALVIGILIGILRTLSSSSGSSVWVIRFAAAWVELFRDIPLLVQVFLWYHVAPFFLPSLKSLPSWLLVSIALGLFTSARIAEQVRAGIQSLPRGQRDAARALGLREAQVYRQVILPVALRIMMPALTSEAMSIVKNSSVAFVVAVAELTQFAMQAQEETARGIEIYLAVTLLYALTAFAVNRVLAFIESRVQVPGIGALARQGA